MLTIARAFRAFRESRVLLLAFAAVLSGCDPPAPSCQTAGSQTLFVANFEADAVGTVPPSTGPALYGPVGAALNLAGNPGTASIEDSPALGARALRISRGATETHLDAMFGDAGDVPCCGTYIIRLRLYGNPVPENPVASPTFSIASLEGRQALRLSLFDGAYYHLTAGSYTRLDGSYDPSQPHNLWIALNLDSRTYSVCVNNQPLTSAQPFVDPEFRIRESLRIQFPSEILEALAASLVIDEVRVSK